MRKLMATVGLIVAPFVAAQADILDFATSTDGVTPDTTSGEIGGALFEWTNFQATGTGTINVFVQIQGQGSTSFQHAYNTTVDNVFDNGSSDQFNHALLLSDIPIVNIGGVDYRQFLLDINEPSGGDLPLLSLTDIQVLQSNVANPDVTTFDSGVLEIPSHVFVYRLDDGPDSTVLLNAALNAGSGQGDMFMYVRDDLFVPDYLYVYLYSSFEGADGGFEEWAVLTGRGTGPGTVIPEPASMVLLGLGVGYMTVRKLRKRA